MNIGEAAKASGLSPKMIRWYEEQGLIPRPPRSEGGYRVYGPKDIERLRFIRRARDLGFGVRQIGQLLALWQDRGRASADVKRLALEHAAALEARIEALRGILAAIRHLAEHCHGDARPDCPILEHLAHDQEEHP
ncbi:MAG: Cu(I)-responsive transcriptional regulator [Rhodovarius sp.]|nr:Cu(I)-responsive transcriptional regulator [Rhodovarius sp.]MCX7933099.1 Cu(I)-responsive transcriptional regulator [Rhodovarius sp.]MDW8313578.1 Cu(I)-responsive transcriptional regulator [Rhodovarius sp.]